MNVLGQPLKVQCFYWRQEPHFPFLGRFRGTSRLANETHGTECLNGLGRDEKFLFILHRENTDLETHMWFSFPGTFIPVI